MGHARLQKRISVRALLRQEWGTEQEWVQAAEARMLFGREKKYASEQHNPLQRSREAEECASIKAKEGLHPAHDDKSPSAMALAQELVDKKSNVFRAQVR